jgi:hypothetical protein
MANWFQKSIFQHRNKKPKICPHFPSISLDPHQNQSTLFFGMLITLLSVNKLRLLFLLLLIMVFFFFFFLNFFDLPISSVKMRVFNKIAKSVPFEKRVPFAIFSHNK